MWLGDTSSSLKPFDLSISIAFVVTVLNHPELVAMAVGDKAQATILNEILALAAEDFYTIGLSPPMGDYRAVTNALQNVPTL